MSPVPTIESSASLLLRLRNPGDEDAWTTFVSVYSPVIRQYCLRRGLQHADGADITQEVFLRVSKAIRSFDYSPARGRFRSWLGMITSNEISSHLVRAGRLKHEVTILTENDEPDAQWNGAFTEHILAVALDRIRGEFEPSTWTAFESAWMRHEAPTDIAAQLGVAIHAVYVNKSRVLKRLETEIRLLADDLPMNPR